MLVNVALVALALPVLVWTAYLAVLAVLSGENRVVVATPGRRTKFDVVVPAHNEELGIEATVANLLAVDYPTELRHVVVVADNCTDATAARARAAGAEVLERTDAVLRGKGYALAHAFERSLTGDAGAVVVVDADTKVTPNLLAVFDTRLRAGATAVQAEYCVANPQASWRTRLMHIGFTLFHDVRSRARERLEVSAGLRGNGMAFAVPVLRQVPHDAFSVVEDVEYGIRLARSGHRVHYAGDAKVFGEMVSSEVASRSQRSRWEGGRFALARRYAWALLAEGARRRSFVLIDLAFDLLVPPLTYVVLATFLGLAASVAWLGLGHGVWWAAVPWLAAFACLLTYVGRGVWLARVGPRAILDLAWAPVYMAWKVALAIRASATRDRGWVRTARRGKAVTSKAPFLKVRRAFRAMVEAVREDHAVLHHYDSKYAADVHGGGESLARDLVTRIGFQMLAACRVMRFCVDAEIPLAPRVASRMIRHLYGSDIHWEARLDPGIVIVHGMGMAISRAARVGRGVILFQHVTLGLGTDPLSRAVGAPLIEQDVHVGAGSTLVGPITLGARSKVTANCFVRTSVPADSLVEASPPTVSVRSRAAAPRAREGAQS